MANSPQDVTLTERGGDTLAQDQVVIAHFKSQGSSNRVTPEPNANGWKIEEEGDATK